LEQEEKSARQPQIQQMKIFFTGNEGIMALSIKCIHEEGNRGFSLYTANAIMSYEKYALDNCRGVIADDV
jgi:hypothetical protein